MGSGRVVGRFVVIHGISVIYNAMDDMKYHYIDITFDVLDLGSSASCSSRLYLPLLTIPDPFPLLLPYSSLPYPVPHVHSIPYSSATTVEQPV
jgi:hypothetical protein